MLLKEIKKNIFIGEKTLFIKIMIKFPARVRRVITQIASTRVFSQMPALISVGEIIRVSFAIFPSSRRRQSKRNYGQFVIASCTCNWEKTGRAKSIEGERGRAEGKKKKKRGVATSCFLTRTKLQVLHTSPSRCELNEHRNYSSLASLALPFSLILIVP